MRCETCEAPTRVPEKQGRPRRYCDRACQQKAYRNRRRPLPTEMTSRPRWVRHDERKRPLTIDGRLASVADPSTWCTHEAAKRSDAGVGVGIVLGDGLGVIDLDDAIEDGGVKPWAAGIVAQHRDDAILVERSMSGRGIHIFLPMGEAPGRRVRDGDVKIETYSRARFIAVTGDRM